MRKLICKCLIQLEKKYSTTSHLGENRTVLFYYLANIDDRRLYCHCYQSKLPLQEFINSIKIDPNLGNYSNDTFEASTSITE